MSSLKSIHKWIIIALLFLPGLIFFLLPIWDGRVGENLWGKELKNSGFISAILLVITLFLSPLVKFFPKVVFFRALNNHKREIGLGLFFYACFHCAAYLLKAYFKKGHISFLFFLHPVILPGLLAFLLMIPLAVTSNDRSIRNIGWYRWKRLHSLFYLTEGFVFIHMAVQGGKMLLWSVAFFLPLLFFQLLRINKNEAKLG